MAREKLSVLLPKLVMKNNLNMNRLKVSTGIGNGTLYGLFDDQRQFNNPSLSVALRICNALNCNLSDLIEDEYYQLALEYDKKRYSHK